MLRLLLGNIEPETSDEELGEFLAKYGFPAWNTIEHLPGDGSRPAVLLTFDGSDERGLDKLRERVHHMYWKSRQLTAMIIGQHMP